MEYHENPVTSADLVGNADQGGDERLTALFLDFVTNFCSEEHLYANALASAAVSAAETKTPPSLVVYLEHISMYNSPTLYDSLLKRPEHCLALFEKALCAKLGVPSFELQLISAETPTPIRRLVSCAVNRIVRISGIAISCTPVRTKPKALFMLCRSCLSTLTVTDVSSGAINRSCGQSGCSLDSLVIVPEKSLVSDVQYAKVQEAFSDIPAGEVPRTVTAVVEGSSLVDRLSPGDRVSLTGVLCVRNGSIQLRVCGIENNQTRQRRTFSEAEEALFGLIKRSNPYSLVARSIAPGVYGHDDVKKAIAVLLFGGTRRTRGDGIALRGEINVLLLGDPGIAKSQLLKFVEAVAPTGVYTSGKGSSAAGLTAAVVRDRHGEFYLEGGAMVLADGGVCCIDEFDKMNETDRVAIHEAMEQQTISIAKAGITTMLSTRTAVFAAANPAFGRYDESRSPEENIEFGCTILSRFDLIFILRDKSGPGDRAVAEHVLALHSGKRTENNYADDDGSAKSVAGVKNSNSRRAEEFMGYLRQYPKDISHSDGSNQRDDNVKVAADDGEPNFRDNVIPVDVLRSYIQYARSRVSPRVGAEAADRLSRFYVSARQEVQKMGIKTAIPITVRQLEAIVRISEALARLELREVVETKDVDEAIRLFQLSTMNAVSQGHVVEGMISPRLYEEVREATVRLRAYLPAGVARRFSDVMQELGLKEHVLRRAVDCLVKQSKLISKDYGRILVKLP